MELRKTRIGAMVGIVALAVAACGGGSGSSSSSATSAASSAGNAASSAASGTESPSSSAAEPAPAAAGTLTIWADDKYAAVMEQVSQQFSQENGVAVSVELIAKDLQTQFVTASQAGTGPDLVMGAHDWIGNLVQNGAIDPVPTDATKSQFLPKAIEGVTFNGQIYGVPYAVENVVLYRNTALAPTAPATWEDLIAAGDQIKAANAGVTEYLALPVGPEGDAYHSYPMFTSGGGQVFGKDADGNYDANQLLLGSPEAVAAMSKIGANGENGTGLLKRSISSDNLVSLFTDQKTAFMLSGPWNLPSIKTAGIQYDISPAPKWADGTGGRPFVGVQAMYVAAKGKNKAIAQEYATNFFATPEVAQALYDAQPRPPALKSVYEAAAAADPDIKKLAEAGKDGDIMPSITAMAAVFAPWGKAEAAIVGGADPAATMNDTAAAINSAIGG